MVKKKYKTDKESKLKLLDELLQSRRGYSISEIMDKLDVSSRDTIRKLFGYENGKIEGIRHGIDWPEYLLEKYSPEEINIIEEITDSNTGKKRFRYSKEDFSLFNDELAIHVIDKILPILERLNQIEGINNIYVNELEEIYEVIERQRNGAYRNRIEKIESGKKLIRSESKKVFNIDENFCDQGFTSILCNAIDQELVLEILYKDPFKNQSKVICHPYLIAESNDRWYLITHIEKAKEKESIFILNNRINKINALPAERIHKIKIMPNINFKKTSVNILEHLESMIGVSIDNWENPNRIKLVLEIDDDLIFYFKTKTFIGYKEKLQENIYTHPSTIKSKELKNKILSFGSKLKVIEPISLRKEINEEIKKMKLNYSS
jgi:predicted DNA-binding transcriptional regulator YafY